MLHRKKRKVDIIDYQFLKKKKVPSVSSNIIKSQNESFHKIVDKIVIKDRTLYIKGVSKLTQDLNLPPFLHQVVGKKEQFDS